MERQNKKPVRKTGKKRIPVDMNELEKIIEKLRGKISEDERIKLEAAMDTLEYLSEEIKRKGVSINRLRHTLFGSGSEKTRHIQAVRKDRSKQKSKSSSESDDDSDPAPAVKIKKKTKNKPKGHGRNPTSAYQNSEEHEVRHAKLNPGDNCPKCEIGRLYRQEPKVLVKLRGQAPIMAEKYMLDCLRCNACGEVFTASMPDNKNTAKYEESAVAMIALMKYGYGTPFYRLERLQKHLGIPLPSSTQWDVLKQHIEPVKILYEQLIDEAAQGRLLHDDDTNAKILSLIKENNATDPPNRKGMFTSAIVSIRDQIKVILFFTGRNYAGENLGLVLWNRKSNLAKPLLMCDGLVTRNLPKGLPESFKIVLALCMVHFRRKYVDLMVSFPDECMHVIEEIAKIYKVDDEIKELGLNDEQRLKVHQEKSRPVMDDLKKWMEDKIKNKEVEPNSLLGELFKSMTQHWTELTRFLHIVGSPIDNNYCEMILKRAIIHRKNSMFFKTTNGAQVGDMFMSLIATAEVAKINPFEYLVSVMKNSGQVRLHPELWLPWSYQDQLLAKVC